MFLNPKVQPFPGKVMRTSSAVAVSLLVVLMAGAGVVFVQRAWSGIGPDAVRNGSVLQLGPNGDLQRALNQARPGDTIVLQAGAVYTGPFTLPVKSGSEFITIQSSRISELPDGVRVSPSKSALFAKLQSAEKSAPIVKTEPRAHHYKFVGIEFSTANEKVVVHDLVRLGDAAQTTLEDVPHHLIIDRSYIHGFPTQDVQRGISLNSADTDITNSYISDIHGKGYEAQGICGWSGPGRYKIINNYVEGSTQNVMFGGSDPRIPNLVPSDIEVRENYFFKPLTWKVGHPSYGGHHWAVKNIFELKNARRVIIDRNVFENNWVDAQAGSAILFTVRNQEGTAPWSIVEDVTFTNNIVKNSPSALNLLGTDDVRPSQRSKKVLISNNLFTNISGTFLTMSGYPNVTISNNTHIQSGNIMTLHGQPSPGFVYENNVTVRDSNGYGVKGDASGEGRVALEQFTPAYSFRNNLIAGANASLYPGNNFYPGSLSDVGFMNVESGDFRLNPRSKYKQLGADFELLPKP